MTDPTDPMRTQIFEAQRIISSLVVSAVKWKLATDKPEQLVALEEECLEVAGSLLELDIMNPPQAVASTAQTMAAAFIALARTTGKDPMAFAQETEERFFFKTSEE